MLTMPFLFAAAIQAVLRSDLALLARATFGYLPLGMLAVSIAAPVTMLLLAGFGRAVGVVSGASGGAGATTSSGTPRALFRDGLSDIAGRRSWRSWWGC